MRTIPLLSVLLVVPVAQAAPTRVIEDEVRCWTTTRSDGSSETRCTMRRRTGKLTPKPVVIPPSLHPLPVPELDLPPPLTQDDIPDAVPEIPEATPQVPDADPFVAPGIKNKPPRTTLKKKTQKKRNDDLLEPYPATPAPRSTASTPTEQRVVDLLNQERRRRGLAPLTLDPIAVKVARAHSEAMCQQRFFSHVAPDGTHPWDRLRLAGARFQAAAENIATGYRSPQAVHQGWLSSPGHRANRLNPKYRRVGVGLYMCGDMPYWTELFMR